MANIVNMPKLGFDMAEGTLIRWVRSEGDSVDKGEVLAEIETDKATVEVEASVGGVVLRHIASEGTVVPVGEPIAVIGQSGEEVDIESMASTAPVADVSEEASPTPEPAPQEADTARAPSGEDGSLPGGVKASPLARRLAEDLGVELNSVQGTGPGGRIVKRDVESQAGDTAPALARREVQPMGVTHRVPVSKLRAAIGRRMLASKTELPHFYVTTEIDAEPIQRLREDYAKILPEDVKISVNDIIVRAAALTLQKFPNLNASLDGDTVVQHGEINVGVAVAVDQGLLTIVIQNTPSKSLPEIGQEIREKAARARAGRVQPEDVEGSTFTVSNLGMFDVDNFIAIINPPEAAILAVGSAREVPVVKDGAIVPGSRMKVTLSADHRVTDGAEAAQWLQEFKQNIENPVRMVL